VGWLIAGRALQAAGACGGAVVTRAILRDLHGREGTARGLGVMTALSAVAAAFAPWVGGVLDVYHGWALMLCALAWRALPETNARRGEMSLLAVLGATRVLIRSRVFVANTLHVACSMGAWMSVVTGFPHLLSNLLGMPPTEYGKWFPLLTAGYIAGNLVTARLAHRVVLERLVLIGSIISIVAVATGVWLVSSYGPLAPLLFIPITFMNFGQGISQQSAIAAAVSEHPAIAGSASGVLGSSQMLAGACSAQLVALLLGDSALPLLLMTLTFVVIGGCLGWVAYRGRSQPLAKPE
jgi:DHA1 family bicyclomycin/chloramphenicol resistance-like MFS transporter